MNIKLFIQTGAVFLFAFLNFLVLPHSALADTASSTPAVTIDSFTTSTSTVLSGGPATLSWTTSNASTTSIDQGIGNVATSSSVVINPATTTTYTLTASNPGGSVTQSLTITIATSTATTSAPVILSFAPATSPITVGEPTLLQWSVTGSPTPIIFIDNGIGTTTNTSTSVTPSVTTIYTLTASNSAGTTTASTTVTVAPISTSPGSGGGGGGNGPIVGGGSTGPVIHSITPGNNVLTQLTPGNTTTPPTTAPPSTTYINPNPQLFTTNLKPGDENIMVKLLQQFLNARGFTVAQTGPGSSGEETMYFGPMTKAAVIKFQEAYAAQILTPYGLTTGTGNVFMTTRQEMNSLLEARQ